MNRIANIEPSIFAFTARPLDKNNGLQATPNRHFDESVGRWLDTEPVGFYQGGNKGGGSLKLNRTSRKWQFPTMPRRLRVVGGSFS